MSSLCTRSSGWDTVNVVVVIDAVQRLSHV